MQCKNFNEFPAEICTIFFAEKQYAKRYVHKLCTNRSAD